MKSKLLVVVALVTVAALGFSAGQSESDRQGEGGELKIWHFLALDGESSRSVALRQITDQFLAENGGVEVSVDVQAWDQLGTKYLAAVASGAGPDISWVPIPSVGDIIDQGAAMDLMPYIQEDWGAQASSDFPSALWEVGQRDGSKYALTTYHMGHALGYRKSMFEEAGIDPRSIVTWDDFVRAAQQLTVDADGNNPTDDGFSPSTVQHWGFGASRSSRQHDVHETVLRMLGEYDMPILDPETHEANWTTPEMIRVFTLLTDLVTEYQVQPQQTIQTSVGDVAVNFGQGLYAISVVGSQKYQDIINGASFPESDMGLMRWPSFSGEGTPIDSWGWAIVANPNSSNPDLAWEFLSHYQSPEADVLTVQTGGQLPTRISTADEPFFETQEAERYDWYVDYMDDGTVIRPFDAPADYADSLVYAFQSVVLEGTSVEEALSAAEDDYNANLR